MRSRNEREAADGRHLLYDDGYVAISLNYGVGAGELVVWCANGESNALPCTVSQAQTTKISRPQDFFVPFRIRPDSDGAIVLDGTGWRPLFSCFEASAVTVPEALRFCARLCHLIADLHERSAIYCLLSPLTAWYHADSDSLALLPFEPVASDTFLPPEARDAIIGRVPRPYLHPFLSDHASPVVDEHVDLFGLGAVCQWLVTGNEPSSSGARAQFHPRDDHWAPVVTDLIARLKQIQGARYETARGAALDFQECAERLERTGSIPRFPLGRQDGAPRLLPPSRVFGREVELEVLNRAYSDAAGRASIVFLGGAPGVGKTRLIEEVRQSIEREGGCLAIGKSGQFSVDEPLHSLTQAFAEVAKWIGSRPPRLTQAWLGRLRRDLRGSEGVALAFAPDLVSLLGNVDPAPELPPNEARNRFVNAITKLIRCLCRPRKPFCLVLDDMQWVDSATIEIFEAVALDPTLRGILFIGIYRDNEVGPDHPLTVAIERSQSGYYPVHRIDLAPLSQHAINEFVATSLGEDQDAVLDLSRWVHEIAKGNPFFTFQLLRSLAAQGLLTYDFVGGRWLWSPDVPERAAFDADVVVFLIERLRFLSQDCLRLLGFAAVLGSGLSHQTLNRASPQDPQAIDEADDAAFLDTIIRDKPSDELTHTDREVQFSHDRLQQAVVEIWSATELKQIQLEASLAVLNGEADAGNQALVSVALSNLGQFEGTLRDPALRLRLADLSLQAARVARNKLAYSDALRKLSEGILWLPEDAWEEHHALAMSLHKEAFRAAYQAGALEQADKLFADVIAKASDPLETGEIMNTRVLLDTAAKRYDDAYAHARQALAQFNIGLPKSSTILPGLAKEAVRLLWAMRGRHIASLAALPELNDKTRRLALTILSSVLPATYFIDPRLMLFCGMRISRLSLANGNAPPSAIGYVIVGLGITGGLERFASGHAWGRVACDLGRRGDDLSVKARALLIFAGFVNFWRAPIETSQQMLADAYTAAIAGGDHQYACYSSHQKLMLGFFSAKSVDTLIAEHRRNIPFVQQTQDPFAILSQTVWRRALERLKEGQAIYAPPGAFFADDDGFHDHLEKLQNPTLVAYHFAIRARLSYLFGDYPDAARFAQFTLMYKEALLGQIPLVDAHVFGGLAAARLLRSADNQSAAHRRLLKRSLIKVRRYAGAAPANFEAHRQLLEVEAEAAKKITPSLLQAYQSVIATAREAGFLDIATIAAWRAAEAAEALGLAGPVTEAYGAEAQSFIAAWGATALTQPAPSVETTSQSTGLAEAPSAKPFALGSGAVAHALSLQLADDARVVKLLAAAVLESGFDEAHYILVDPERRLVVARADAETGEWLDHAGSPIESMPAVLTTVLDLVDRRGRDVYVGDTASDPRFAHADRLGVQALACVPAKSDGHLQGQLYLSAASPVHISPDAARSVRLAASEILAQLTKQSMRQTLARRSRELKHAERRADALDKVHRELASFLPKAISRADSSHTVAVSRTGDTRQMSALFVDVQSYTVLVEEFGAVVMSGVVDRRFSRFYDEIVSRGGDLAMTIGDEIFAVFLDGELSEDHANRAVEAAAAIRQSARELNLNLAEGEPEIIVNIGINSGPAVVSISEYGEVADRRRALSTVGSSINVASRIASLARDGAVLLGADTCRVLAPRPALRSLGHHSLKNVSKSVEVFELVDDHDRQIDQPLRKRENTTH